MTAYCLFDPKMSVIFGIFLKEEDVDKFFRPGLLIETTEIAEPKNTKCVGIVYRVFPTDFHFSKFEDALAFKEQEKIPNSYIVSQIIYEMEN